MRSYAVSTATHFNDIRMLIEVLKKYWGYKKFKEHQRPIIESVMTKKDTLVILPTGGGKSLCYQLPSLIMEGLVIVVSPLIALMKSQVDFLQSKNIPSAFFNSTLSRKQVIEVKEILLSRTLKILYVSPETLNKAEMINFLQQVPITLIAVDEAHCISDWGHDFRPEYRKLKHTIKILKNVPAIALTATATPQVRKDIMYNLGMDDANVFVGSFNRPNLHYEVRAKVQPEKKIVQFIKSKPGQSGIVYCQNRKKSEELADLLKKNDIQAAPYHAGLDHSIREKNQDAFLSNDIEVIVATIAFGMGIDKPDVRFVIHFDAPRSLEGYYQETGRAGRDGNSADCVLFYDPADVNRFEKFNNNKSVLKRQKLNILIKEVHAYAVSYICRRQQILYYFGEAHAGYCSNCDNCKHPDNIRSYEGKILLRQVLETVQVTKERYASKYIIEMLLGLESPQILNNNHHKLPIFGMGKKHFLLWESIVRQATLFGYLFWATEGAVSLKLSPKGLAFLANPTPIRLYNNQVYHLGTKANLIGSELVVDKNLYTQLLALREAEAKKRKIKPYLIFEESMLNHMATHFPTHIKALVALPGIGLSKAQKFGEPFTTLIASYVEEHGIEPVATIIMRPSGAKVGGRIQIIQQIDRKIPLEAIAKSRNLTYNELIKELEKIVASGVQINLKNYINKHLSKEQQEELYNYFYQADVDNIERACNELMDDFEEEQIRLMRMQFLAEVAN